MVRLALESANFIGDFRELFVALIGFYGRGVMFPKLSDPGINLL